MRPTLSPGVRIALVHRREPDRDPPAVLRRTENLLRNDANTVSLAAGKKAHTGGVASVYIRHRPERTLLYRLVQEHYPTLEAHPAVHETALSGYVEREFEDHLRCDHLEHGFLPVRCERCRAEGLVAFRCKRPSFCPGCGARRIAASAALRVDSVFSAQPVTSGC